MKRLFLLLGLFLALLSQAQNKTSTYTKTINLDPENNGMLGSVTMVYAFTNCFGEATMAFGYKNAYFTAVRYKGKDYTAEELGLSNLDGHTTSFNVQANYYFGNGFVNSSKLTYILNNYDVGCYGQTDNISSKNENHNSNLNSFSVNFENATFRISGSLAFKIDNYEKDKARQRQFFSLLDQAENTSNPEAQIKKLDEAMSYAKTGGEKRMVEAIRVKAEAKIAQAKSEAEAERSTTAYSDKESKDENQSDNEEDEDEDEDENPSSTNGTTTDYSQLTDNTRRTADLSSEKTTAAAGALAASAVLASQAERWGLGGRANMGDELFSYGPELYFMFDDHYGMNIHYALGDDDTFGTESTFDAYEIGAGLIFDFSTTGKNNLVDDGFGLGLEVLYGQFERDIVGESSSYRSYFEEGSILSVGASIYLGMLKIGYTYPVSFERYENDTLDADYSPGGSIIAALFIYF
ncbi:hypothetical protein [Winogradskyella flava]|uniref:Outer membrane protein beta-barrel domain-containing protein n=1 Tax=Winogradskyella flava TaxID=1884876 RepID=A0A842IV40_9FLAO|nr:hypothetical protein [Winogradskyella flava]MBC2845593.1 hypothetical protein [Winogradskyella flava]